VKTPRTSRYAMIMAGGAGKRLWPMSRPDRPKQLLPLIDGTSLIQLAAQRLDGVVQPSHRLVCTGERHRDAVRLALPAFTDAQILGEPVGRDTVNAVGLTAAVLHARDPDAVFAVLTSDHLIEPPAEFVRAMDVGFTLVENDPRRFVTFAIEPTRPATGFGYVERGEPIDGYPGAFHALQFVEKPDAATAQEYLDAGTFGWNSGMFVFHAGRFMAALDSFLPPSAAGLRRVAAAWNTPDAAAVLAEVYPTLEATSVDYGVMEPAARDDELVVCCVPMAVKWRDVGSWPSYGETLKPDANECRTHGRAIHIDGRNVLAVADDPDHLIATVGCRDLIVVHTSDVTMVCPVEAAEDVKKLAEAAGRD